MRFLLLAAVIISTSARADHTISTLMAQAAAGAGSSVNTATSPAEAGRHSFQFHPSASGVTVVLQESLNGTLWFTVHVFAGVDEIWTTPTCGACVFRPYKPDTTTGTATVIHTVSGATVASVTP